MTTQDFNTCYTSFSKSKLFLHRYAMFMIVGVLLLIFIGGQVKSTNSGMSVPDWPNTYGHFMFSFPWEKMVGGIFWEHSHRLLASGMGLFTIILTILVYKIDDRIWVKRIGLLALFAVILQGALGGLTVMYNLPAWISSSHGTLAQIYLCIVTSIALVTSPCWIDNPIQMKDSSKFSLRKITTITMLIVFIQLLIGAIMRHSEAGLAIPDFPLMYGKLFPPLSESALIEANNQLLKSGILSKSGNSFITAPQMFIHFLHRFWAFVVVTSVTLTFINVNKKFKNIKQLHFPALVLLMLVIVQFCLGVLTILTEKQFTITSFHVVVGASTLATSFVLMVRSKHLLCT